MIEQIIWFLVHDIRTVAVIDIAIIGACIALCLFIGMKSALRIKNAQRFLRSLLNWPLKNSHKQLYKKDARAELDDVINALKQSAHIQANAIVHDGYTIPLLKTQKVIVISEEDFKLLNDILVTSGVQRSEPTMEDWSYSPRARDRFLHSVMGAVIAALGSDSLTTSQKSRLLIKKADDFRFYISKYTMKHIILELLEYALQNSDQTAAVNLWVADNALRIQYTRSSNSVDCDGIFKLDHGIGTQSIGLAFCHSAIVGVGGRIYYHCGTESSMEFVIQFPSTAES